MAYREVSMEEIREAIRQWQAGYRIKQVAVLLGLDPKTVRRYVRTAEAQGVVRGGAAVSDDLLGAIVEALAPRREPAHGDAWRLCEQQREAIQCRLDQRLRLSRVHSLLRREGHDVPYSTLHRFAVQELGFGRKTTTIAVLEGEPGQELQVDTGWMTLLEPDASGRRRRFRAWIFTPSFSRYRFVYPVFRETTATAIEACEAAWAFYGGVYAVLIPDNTKAIVDRADPLTPRLVAEFLEYAQARGFVVDPARVRRPQDKARVERSVRYVRDACFAGERLFTIEQARERALSWCESEAGLRIHSRTQRRPRELFAEQERPRLLPAPEGPFEIPLWCDPKVARDQFAQVAKALYSLPKALVGQTLRARADSQTVRFYQRARVVKVHARQPPGGRAIDPADFPEDKRICAHRDLKALLARAAGHGEVIHRYAALLLDVPLPWTRMRAVYALLRLVTKYGAARVSDSCRRALEADMLDVRRLQRMLEQPRPQPLSTPRAPVIPIARFLRAPSQYALPLVPKETSDAHRTDQS